MKKIYFLIPCLLPLLFFFGCDDMTPREKASAKVKKQFIKQMKAKGLFAIGVGGAEREGKTTQIAVTFNSDQILDISLARKLIVESGKCLLHIINEQTEENRDYFEPCPPTINIARIIIIGKNSENLYETPKNISGVVLANSEVFYDKYSIISDHRRLVIIKEESYEEAKKIVLGIE